MAQGRFSAWSARIAASISMRLLVVRGSPPDSSFSRAPARTIAPQPPGPGLPLQAPSVKISTSVMVEASGSSFEPARELEHHPLDDSRAFDLDDVEMLAKAVDELADEQLGGGGAGGEAEGRDPVEPGEVQFGGAADEAGAGALALGDLDEADGIGAVGGADHQHRLAAAGDLLDRGLAVRGRVADVVCARRLDRGKAAFEDGDDLRGIIDREGRLGEVGEVRGIGGRD